MAVDADLSRVTNNTGQEMVTMESSRTVLAALRTLLLTALLAGCAANPPQLDQDRLAEDLADQGVALPESEVPPVEGELGLREAIHQAVWRNPRMQEVHARLDLVAADVIEASQFTNPAVSLGVLRPEGGGRSEFRLGLAWGVSGLLLRGSRRDMARSHWESTRLQLAEGIAALASETEHAWYALVSARQQAQVKQLELRAAELGAKLGERFHVAGNIDELRYSRLRINAAETRLALADARQRERQARLQLAHLMGVPGHADGWDVPARLPLPLAGAEDHHALVEQALERRLDVRALDHALDGLTEGVALVRRYRWLGDIEPGLEFERETDGTRLWGGTFRFTLPIFHQNQAGVQRAEARLADGGARRASLVNDITAEVHERLASLDHNRQRFAVMQDQLLPGRARVVTLTQERVNFMFDDVFDLLQVKQEELAGWQRSVVALGEYWQARAALGFAVASELAGGEPGSAGYLDTDGLEHEPAAMNHGGHGQMDHGEQMDHKGHEHMDHEGHENHDGHHGHDGHSADEQGGHRS